MRDVREMRAPRHPRIERRSLVLWTGFRSGLDLGRIERGAIGAIALPLRHAADEPALLTRARQEGLGIVLPGQAWFNQLPPEERGAGFAELPYAQPEPLDLEARRLTAQGRDDYAEQFVDAQLAAGATLVTTPAHVFGSELGAGRAQELELADTAVAAWEERQGWRPPPQRPGDPPRELYAAIAVRPGTLPGAVDDLIAAYAPLAVDGCWLTVMGDGREQTGEATLGAVAHFALGMQEATGRPVVVAGIATMHEALLASGVAAACAGPHGLRASFPPAATERDGVTGIGVPAYHPAILGAIPLGAGGEEARTRLFATEPCRCGEHVAFEPPRGRRERATGTGLTPVLDEARLAARIARANRLRDRLGLPALSRGWQAVADAARARRAEEAGGVDAARDSA